MGLIRTRSSPAPLILALASLATAPQARAADFSPGAQADLHRALVAVGPSSSETPALRQERLTQEPSPGFLLGAALGAWINAAAQLAFDRAHPAGAGPPHASQAGGDPEALAEDCAEETAAFSHLDERRQAMGLTAGRIVAVAAVDPAVLPAWNGRETAPPDLCR